jgi:hypothetical protein
MRDIEVNNRLNSLRGGLPAHNYWDNKKEFIPEVADLLREVVKTGNVPYHQPDKPCQIEKKGCRLF